MIASLLLGLRKGRVLLALLDLFEDQLDDRRTANCLGTAEYLHAVTYSRPPQLPPGTHDPQFSVSIKDPNYMGDWPENAFTYTFRMEGETLHLNWPSDWPPGAWKGTFRKVEGEPVPAGN